FRYPRTPFPSSFSQATPHPKPATPRRSSSAAHGRTVRKGSARSQATPISSHMRSPPPIGWWVHRLGPASVGQHEAEQPAVEVLRLHVGEADVRLGSVHARQPPHPVEQDLPEVLVVSHPEAHQ